jgi:hypothetical protein
LLINAFYHEKRYYDSLLCYDGDLRRVVGASLWQKAHLAEPDGAGRKKEG